MTRLIVDEALLEGAQPVDGVAAVPPDRRGCRAADAAVAAIAAAGPDAVVMAWPAGDQGAAGLLGLARAMGAELVRLPGDIDVARWTVAMASSWCRAGWSGLPRRLQSLAGAATCPALPRRSWGRGAASVPALRPHALARWSWQAWVPCPCCRGGGLASAPCARCGWRR